MAAATLVLVPTNLIRHVHRPSGAFDLDMVLNCKWFMLPMTLDMPDEALAEGDNSEDSECAVLCESGARPQAGGLYTALWFAS